MYSYFKEIPGQLVLKVLLYLFYMKLGHTGFKRTRTTVAINNKTVASVLCTDNTTDMLSLSECLSAETRSIEEDVST